MQPGGTALQTATPVECSCHDSAMRMLSSSETILSINVIYLFLIEHKFYIPSWKQLIFTWDSSRLTVGDRQCGHQMWRSSFCKQIIELSDLVHSRSIVAHQNNELVTRMWRHYLENFLTKWRWAILASWVKWMRKLNFSKTSLKIESHIVCYHILILNVKISQEKWGLYITKSVTQQYHMPTDDISMP